MKSVQWMASSAAVLVAGLAAGAHLDVRAHHSFAMFDTANPITISGVVTALQWTNPHVYIELDVTEGQSTKHWTIELGSPSILQRGGWKFNTDRKSTRLNSSH